MAVVLASLLLTACGRDAHVSVLSAPFFQPAVVARYPLGSPERAALRLMLAIQYNDPTAAANYFVPAWRLTSRSLAPTIRNTLAGAVTLFGHLRSIADYRRESRATLVVAGSSSQVVLELERLRGGWKLSRVVFGSLTLAPPRLRTR